VLIHLRLQESLKQTAYNQTSEILTKKKPTPLRQNATKTQGLSVPSWHLTQSAACHWFGSPSRKIGSSRKKRSNPCPARGTKFGFRLVTVNFARLPMSGGWSLEKVSERQSTPLLQSALTELELYGSQVMLEERFSQRMDFRTQRKWARNTPTLSCR